MSDETKVTPAEARALVQEVLRPMDFCHVVAEDYLYDHREAGIGDIDGTMLEAQDVRNVCAAAESLAAQVEERDKRIEKLESLIEREEPGLLALAAQVERYRALLLDVAWSGVEDDDDLRVKYRTVQIDHDTWRELRALAEEAAR